MRKKMKLLSVEDFEDTKFDPNWNSFDYLLEIARVGQEKLQKQNFKFRNTEEKKRHDFGYLKYFLYNAPKPEARCEEENMSFKQGIKRLNKNNNGGLKRKRKLKEEDGKKERPVGPNPPPELPENFKQHIVEKMGGSDWVLVIKKQLFFSDVNPDASRFSIPFSRLKTHEFLTKTEAENLKDKKAIKVCLLEPSMEETDITFRRWDMTKSSMYVMTTTWNNVVKNNQLEVDDIVQLWSFRVNSTLCFALEKLQVPRSN